MLSCPACLRSFPSDAHFCPIDGTGLRPAAEVPAASADEPLLGQLVAGRYELRRVVADGAMGRVYEGIDHQAQERVAIKALHREVAEDEIAVARFRREFEISRELSSPHVVKMHDFVQQAGRWLLVMEYLDGEELRVLLQRGTPFDAARWLRIVAQAAIALDAAHKARYVHRDLKPDNLFLCASAQGDVLKILDFGSVRDNNLGSRKLTVMGTTLGSPYYMAPEQAQGLDSLDGRADVFSLAAIAYEWMSGQVPFDGKNAPMILMKILSSEPKPISSATPGVVPPAVEHVVLERGLVKNVALRAASVGEWASELAEAYGLSLSVAQLASWSLGELRAQLEQAKAAAAARGPSVALEASGDPFAAPPPQPLVATQLSAGAEPRAAQMDATFSMSRYDSTPPQAPNERPAWLFPALVAAGLLLAAVVLLIVLR